MDKKLENSKEMTFGEETPRERKPETRQRCRSRARQDAEDEVRPEVVRARHGHGLHDQEVSGITIDMRLA